MHEVSLMADILSLIEQDARQHNINKVKEIELIVGDLSNVMYDALYMALEIHKNQGHALLTRDTRLIIERENAKARCKSCRVTYEPDQRLSFCPRCQKNYGLLISGETFIVKAYEGSSLDESNS